MTIQLQVISMRTITSLLCMLQPMSEKHSTNYFAAKHLKYNKLRTLRILEKPVKFLVTTDPNGMFVPAKNLAYLSSFARVSVSILVKSIIH